MEVLTQFVFRLSFGLAVAMLATPPRWVISGFYRNHLYVLLGLNVLAALVAGAEPARFSLWPPVTAAGISYVGAVVWLYEKPKIGMACLAGVAAASLVGALESMGQLHGAETVGGERSNLSEALWTLDILTGGLLLGFTIGAMFLGHWYLNSPTMRLSPLHRLVLTLFIAVLLRGLVAGTGLALELSASGAPGTSQISFLVLRWLSAIVGLFGLTWMTRETLKIPNTQAATGILYVAVIAVFLGELTSLLLSRNASFPL